MAADTDSTGKEKADLVRVKVEISGNSEQGYLLTVWQLLGDNKYYRHDDFDSALCVTAWGARRKAKRLLRRALRAERTTIRETVT